MDLALPVSLQRCLSERAQTWCASWRNIRITLIDPTVLAQTVSRKLFDTKFGLERLPRFAQTNASLTL